MITIKGIRQGLLVALRRGGWQQLLAELQRRLDESPAFFKGGRVSLDVGSLPLTENDLRQARDMLVRHDVTLHAVVGKNAQTEASAQALGLVINLGLERRPPQPTPPAPQTGPNEALLKQGTLRSGQSVRYPGHVVVIGDVNPGAEIVAGGHVVVWGKLRGTVHAGAMGDNEAMICALDLSPTQLRIASHITRSPEERRRKPTPEVATVHNGQIVATPWK